jgi:hypothetical protein
VQIVWSFLFEIANELINWTRNINLEKVYPGDQLAIVLDRTLNTNIVRIVWVHDEETA